MALRRHFSILDKIDACRLVARSLTGSCVNYAINRKGPSRWMYLKDDKYDGEFLNYSAMCSYQVPYEGLHVFPVSIP